MGKWRKKPKSGGSGGGSGSGNAGNTGATNMQNAATAMGGWDTRFQGAFDNAGSAMGDWNNRFQEGFDQSSGSINDWNDRFQDSYGQAADYAQNNQFSNAASGYIDDTLSGSMGRNPFMQNVYNQTAGHGQQEGLDYLRSFLGGAPGNGPNTGGSGSGTKPRPSGGGGGGGSSWAGGTRPSSGGGGGGNIPDSTVGAGFFSKHINELFDPSRLDPKNDPTLKPMVDAYQNEAQESYYRGLNDLVNSAEAGGRFGSGMYSAQRSQAQDEYSEANAQAMSQMYQHARDQAIANQMDALGLVNTRDISEGQIAAQRDATSSAAGSAAASIRAQQDMHNQEMQLQGIQQMLQSSQYDLGLQGQMGALMSQNQLGAMQAGLGYGQLGMSGFDAQRGFGQLGVGAYTAQQGAQQGWGQLGLGGYNAQQGAQQGWGGLGLNANQGIAGIGQNQQQLYQQQQAQQAADRARQQQLQFQRDQYNDRAPFDMIDRLTRSMQGLNTMGGYEMDPGYVAPNAGPGAGGFNFDDFMGGIFAGGAAYNRGQQ